jgi:hypothetical protein
VSWKLITDRAALGELMVHESTCTRVVMLDPDGIALGARDLKFESLDALTSFFAAGPTKVYLLLALDTDPASVFLFDEARQGADDAGFIGAYVWTGDGGMITSGKDPRMVLLADLVVKVDAAGLQRTA